MVAHVAVAALDESPRVGATVAARSTAATRHHRTSSVAGPKPKHLSGPSRRTGSPARPANSAVLARFEFVGTIRCRADRGAHASDCPRAGWRGCMRRSRIPVLAPGMPFDAALGAVPPSRIGKPGVRRHQSLPNASVSALVSMPPASDGFIASAAPSSPPSHGFAATKRTCRWPSVGPDVVE